MTLTTSENERLAAAVDAAIDRLKSFPAGLVRLGTHNLIHDYYSERVVSLGRYLEVAISAIRQGLFSPGYALLRCAMEHHLIDHLFMRADRYVSYAETSQETFERWQRSWEEGGPGTENIVDMTRSPRGHTRIVHRGPHVTDEDGNVVHDLSIYFAYLEEYDPLLGPPEEQRYMEVSWSHLEVLKAQAKRQQRLYGQAFRWKSIRGNLKLNGIYVGEDLVRLNVHHRFLSAFVHVTPSSDKIVQARASSVIPMIEAERPHPAWELGHLYAAAFAGRELEVLLQSAATPPRVGFRDRADLEAVAREARTASRHLWFPGDPPHPYDVFNRRRWEAWRSPDWPTAQDVGVNEPYYRNPFDRLKALHQASSAGPYRYVPAFFLPPEEGGSAS